MEIDDDKIEGDKLSVDRRKFPIFMKIRVLEEKRRIYLEYLHIVDGKHTF